MPTYCYSCDNCETNFEVLCSHAQSAEQVCELCQQKATKLLTTCNLKFANPKDTSKWDNFSYRAGYNLDKAKTERRDAEAREKMTKPYRDIDDSTIKGVFGKHGIDPKET